MGGKHRGEPADESESEKPEKPGGSGPHWYDGCATPGLLLAAVAIGLLIAILLMGGDFIK